MISSTRYTFQNSIALHKLEQVLSQYIYLIPLFSRDFFAPNKNLYSAPLDI